MSCRASGTPNGTPAVVVTERFDNVFNPLISTRWAASTVEKPTSQTAPPRARSSSTPISTIGQTRRRRTFVALVSLPVGDRRWSGLGGGRHHTPRSRCRAATISGATLVTSPQPTVMTRSPGRAILATTGAAESQSGS